MTNSTRNAGSDSHTNGKRTGVILALVLVIVLCLAGGLYGGHYLIKTYSQIHDVENSHGVEPVLPEAMQGDTENPIDFEALYDQNIDIYGWIYLPDTSISYPVCQSSTDDTYYLTHDASKRETELGAIFSEHQFNNADFQDRVTVLYGHNGFGDTMFTALHRFERDDFFDTHDKIYLYAPGHVYTYKVVSAFTAGDEHLMALYNFQTDEGLSDFIADVTHPDAIDANTRAAEISSQDKLLVLSTCASGALEATSRYLVCGVMMDDKQTR